jgi:hypothetical protein
MTLFLFRIIINNDHKTFNAMKLSLLIMLKVFFILDLSAQRQVENYLHYGSSPVNAMEITTEEPAKAASISDKSKDHFWFNLGLGGSNFGLAACLSFSYQYRNNVFTHRRLTNIEVPIMTSDPLESIIDNGLLYGIARNNSFGKVTLSAGLAYVRATKRGEKISGSGSWFGPSKHEKEVKSFIGFPYELQIFATPFSFMGIGFYFFGNSNSIRPFSGLMLSLQFGKMK